MPGRQNDRSKEALSRLPQLDLAELRELWRHLYKTEAVPRFSRELLARAVAYRIQEVASGGPRLELQRQLRQIGLELQQTGRLRVRTQLKPGTPSSQLATGLSPLAPRSGLERSDFAHWRYSASRAASLDRWTKPFSIIAAGVHALGGAELRLTRQALPAAAPRAHDIVRLRLVAGDRVQTLGDQLLDQVSA